MSKYNKKQINKPRRKKYSVKTYAVLSVFVVVTLVLTIFNISMFRPSKTVNDNSQTQQEVARANNDKQNIASISKTFINLYISQKWDALKVLSSAEYSKKLEGEIIPLFKALNSQANISFKLMGDSYSVEGVTNNDAVVTVSLRIEKTINKVVIENQKEMKIFFTKTDGRWLVTNMSDTLIQEENKASGKTSTTQSQNTTVVKPTATSPTSSKSNTITKQ